ncbi:MAG TPA: AI-2E family transporter [Bacilli bacterium]
MEHFIKNRFFVVAVFILLGLFILYMLILIKPILLSIYIFAKAVLAPFLVAMIISYVLNPVVCLLNDRKVPRTIAVLLIYAVFIISVTVVMLNLIPMFMKQLKELNEHLPQFTVQAQSWFNGLNDNKFLPESVRTGINHSLIQFEAAVSKSISHFLSDIGATINLLFIIFIIPFLAFYMLKDFHLIGKTTLAMVPKLHRKHSLKLFLDIDTALGHYVRGQFLVCILIGILAYIGYWSIGMPYPLLLALVAAVFNIIPYLGPFFGAAPAIIMASTISLKMMLLVVAVNLVIQILEGNVISPQIVGKSLHMHPLSIIFVLLVGGELAGIAGLILAVPFFAVMKVMFHHFYLYFIQRRKVI